MQPRYRFLTSVFAAFLFLAPGAFAKAKVKPGGIKTHKANTHRGKSVKARKSHQKPRR
jgi:hypothetical protein